MPCSRERESPSSLWEKLKVRVLLLSHELGYPQAPIALLQSAKTLGQGGHDVFLVALNPGWLGNESAVNQARPLRAGHDLFDPHIATTL